MAQNVVINLFGEVSYSSYLFLFGSLCGFSCGCFSSFANVTIFVTSRKWSSMSTPSVLHECMARPKAIFLQTIYLIHDNKEKFEKKFLFPGVTFRNTSDTAYILISSREYTRRLTRIYSSAHENIRIGQCVYGHRLMHIQVLAYEPMCLTLKKVDTKVNKNGKRKNKT